MQQQQQQQQESTTTKRSAQHEPPALELGWTRVNRRPRKITKSNDTTAEIAAATTATTNDNTTTTTTTTYDNDDWLWCCDDPSCRRSGGQQHQEALFLDNLNEQKNTTTPRNVVVDGQVIFLLHEPNPDWFQGYLFRRSGGGHHYGGGLNLTGKAKEKPWGLLAKQLELDECLQCADGGYRQINLTVYPYQHQQQNRYNNNNNNNNHGYDNADTKAILVRYKKTTFDKVEWTGGDMIQLQSPSVRMSTSRLVTGRKSVPFIEDIFAGLLHKLRQNDSTSTSSEDDKKSKGEEQNTGVLDLLPDCAVVIGNMQLILPISKDDDDE